MNKLPVVEVKHLLLCSLCRAQQMRVLMKNSWRFWTVQSIRFGVNATHWYQMRQSTFSCPLHDDIAVVKKLSQSLSHVCNDSTTLTTKNEWERWSIVCNIWTAVVADQPNKKSQMNLVNLNSEESSSPTFEVLERKYPGKLHLVFGCCQQVWRWHLNKLQFKFSTSLHSWVRYWWCQWYSYKYEVQHSHQSVKLDF